MKFWSDEARNYLQWMGRQDLIDKGDDLAERVAALTLTSINRLNQYAEKGHLYDGSGGSDLLGHDSNSLTRITEFVDVKLRDEIGALEKLLEVFSDLDGIVR
jgi:DNA-binding ferritin-like protein